MPAPDALTPREHEVLLWAARGLGNRDIAEQLDVTEKTVEFHLTNVYSKLGATTRTQAVVLGIARGNLSLEAVTRRRQVRVSLQGEAGDLHDQPRSES